MDPWDLPAGSDTLLDRFTDCIPPALRPDVTWCDDTKGRGSAGCLKDAAPSFGGGVVLFIDGVVWLDDDVEWMVRQHRVSENALTVFCASKPLTHRGTLLRNVEPVSIYCCEPDVVEYVAQHGTQDVAAHLIPALQRDGRRVGVVNLRGTTREVCDWGSYLTVVGDALRSARSGLDGDYEQRASGVWCHRSARIASSARVLGPVLIDRDCVVGSGAVIVGPTVLGPGTSVAPQARLVRTVSTGPRTFAMRPVVSDQLLVSHVDGFDLQGAGEGETAGCGPVSGSSCTAVEVSELVDADSSSDSRATVVGFLLLAVVLAWALSGKAVHFWHAWTQSELLSAG